MVQDTRDGGKTSFSSKEHHQVKEGGKKEQAREVGDRKSTRA